MTDDERAEQIRARHQRIPFDYPTIYPNGVCDGHEEYVAWPCDIAWLLAERDALLSKVARVEVQRDEARARAVMLRNIVDKTDEALQWLPYDDCLIRYDNNEPTTTARCNQQTPFNAYTEQQCSKPLGHEGAHVFTSLNGRTPLEVMPK